MQDGAVRGRAGSGLRAFLGAPGTAPAFGPLPLPPEVQAQVLMRRCLPVPRRYQSFRERLIRGKSDLHRQLAAELEQLMRITPYG